MLLEFFLEVRIPLLTTALVHWPIRFCVALHSAKTSFCKFIAIENKTGALHALPSVPSVYSGTSYVVPFSRTPQGYQCSGCSAVSTFSVMYIYPGSGSTNLVLNISATGSFVRFVRQICDPTNPDPGSGQCAVQEESLVITAVTPHSGAVDYYGYADTLRPAR